METWSGIRGFVDGDPLDAKTLNVPIGQLGERTTYLYSKIKEFIGSGAMSSVVLSDVELSDDDWDSPSPGNAVYLRKDGKFAAAKATMSLYDNFKASDSAFTVGMLMSRGGSIGTVIMSGSFDMSANGSGLAVSDVIEQGEDFRAGRYYLSSSEAGKLTSNPNGPVIYVCTISGETVAGSFKKDAKAILSPQFLDIGTSHVHRTAVLTARPAGSVSAAGYIPSDASYSDEQVGPLALRFGGTWTAGSQHVNYTFYLGQETANWPDGVTLKWKVNGKESDEYKAEIHAPDEEVSISNGLTARLSLPASDGEKAYSGLAEGQRTWDTLTFPEAGAGWLRHEAFAVASGDGDVRVAVKWDGGSRQGRVSVAIVEKAQVCVLGGVSDGDSFTYGDATYAFSSAVESYDGDRVVPVGTCLAESAAHLAKALSADSSDGSGVSFLVFESDSGKSASLVIVGAGASEVSAGGIVSSVSVVDGDGVDVPGTGKAKAVVYDDVMSILTSDPVVDVSPFSWSKSGSVSLMLYTMSSTKATAEAGTVLSADVRDDEPDAMYDYSIGMDPSVSAYWPPVPAKSAALVVNGVEMDNKALVPDSPTVSFGHDTVHWFSDEKGRKPWPEAFERRGAEIAPSEDKTMVMHWVRGFQGATGPVTSIQARDGSPIKIYGFGTDGTANTGDLEIDADFEFEIDSVGEPGYNVPKRSVNGALVAGPVVEKIVGGPGVKVMSAPGCPSGQGTVTVALDNGSYRDMFSDIALENAEQAKVGMFPYIRLRGYSGSSISSPSAFTATMRVPTDIPDGNYSLAISASVFGENGFSGASQRAACVKFSYNILPDFSHGNGLLYRSLKSSLLVPNSERTVTIPFGHQEEDGVKYNGFDPILVTTDDDSTEDMPDVVAKEFGSRIPSSSEFSGQMVIPGLRPGYFVGIRIARAVSPSTVSEPYTYGIGFMNLTWELVEENHSGTTSASSNGSDIEQIRDELDSKVDKNVMAQTHIGTGNINQIRDSVEKIAAALGASVSSRE